MSILITADLHFSANPRDAYRLETANREFPELLKKHDCSQFFVCGDLCEDKEGYKADFVNAVADFFKKVSLICPVVILQGNHDWLISSNDPFFGFLKHIPHIQWVAKPTQIGNRLLLPHSHNPKEAWKNLKFKGVEFVFCHQTFDGAISEGGRPLTGTDLSLLPSEVVVISGDVHTPQEFENLIYIGAPYAVDFSDSYEGRVLLLNQNGHLTSIPIPGPQKRLLELSSPTDLQTRKELRRGDILKVRFPYSASHAGELAEVTKRIRTWGEKHGYVIHQVQPVLTNVATKPRKLEKVARSDTEVVRSFAKARKLNDGTLNVGLKLLEG